MYPSYKKTFAAILLSILGILALGYPQTALTWIFASKHNMFYFFTPFIASGLFFIAYKVGNIAWYEHEQAFEEVLDLGEALLNTRVSIAHSAFFSLGQSPAWVVRSAQILADDYFVNNFNYLPFSSKFYVRKTDLSKIADGEEVTAYFSRVFDFPTKQQINSYRNYLTTCSMDPASIVNRLNDNGVITVIVEYPQTGASLASFLSVIAAWSREQGILNELERAVSIVCLKDGNNQLAMTYLVEPDTGKKFKIKWLDGIPYARLNQHQHKTSILNFLWKDHKEDRLVPYYPPSLWEQEPIQGCDAQVATIDEALVAQAKSRLALLYSEKRLPQTADTVGQNYPKRRIAAMI